MNKLKIRILTSTYDLTKPNRPFSYCMDVHGGIFFIVSSISNMIINHTKAFITPKFLIK